MDIWGGVKKILSTGVPLLADALIEGPGGLAKSIVAKVLNVDKDSPEAMEEALRKASPEQWASLKQAEMQHEEALVRVIAENDTARIREVNATMREETKLGHPWAGSWRPFWGFVSAVAFGIAVVGIFLIVGVAIYKGDAALLGKIPEIIFALTTLFGIPGAILGVASWHRGRMQRIEAGEQPAGLLHSLAKRIGNGG